MIPTDRRVLLTSFEPFGGERVNPSMTVVDGVARTWRRAERLVTAVLPVSFVAAADALERLLVEHDPDVLVSVGLAGGRTRVGLERVALNLCDARIPDNDGDQPADREVVAGGPLALPTSLPVKAAARVLAGRGVVVDLSTSAGTFVCNAVFYRGLAWSTGRAGRRAGFVHVPPGSIDASVAAVSATVDAALDIEVDDDTPVGSTH